MADKNQRQSRNSRRINRHLRKKAIRSHTDIRRGIKAQQKKLDTTE